MLKFNEIVQIIQKRYVPGTIDCVERERKYKILRNEETLGDYLDELESRSSDL